MGRGVVRDNAFLIAAVALPLVVVGFFLLFTAIPRWMVPPPQYDVIFSTTEYSPVNPGVSVDFAVHHGTLQATIRPVQANSYAPRINLWRYAHQTGIVREVPIDLPKLAPGDPPQTIEPLPGHRVLAQTQAPDGYEVRSGDRGSRGIVGEIFGMNRSDRAIAIAKGGRVVSIPAPGPHEHRTPHFVGWVVAGGSAER